MTQKPSLLFIAHRIPYPPNKGDKIRTFNEIRFLSRFFSVDLVALVDDPQDFEYRSKLKAYCRRVRLFGLSKYLAFFKGGVSFLTGGSITQGYFGHKKARRTVASLMNDEAYKAVICFSSPMAGFLPKDNKKNRPRLIMDFCDVDSEKWRQYSRECRGPAKLIYKMESRRLRRYEIEMNRRFHASIFVSAQEADLFRSFSPFKSRVHSVSNGVDYEFFSSEKATETYGLETFIDKESLVLMFPGVMDYHANVRGVSWFATRVMPKLQSRLEKEGVSARFDIVGKNPVPEIRALAEKGRIRVTGFVEDIRPYYQAAHVVIIPLQVARGIQNKVLEAMAMARPVVATPQSVEGIGVVENIHFKAAETPEQFIESILELVRSPKAGKQMGGRARAFIEEKFSWDECLMPLLRILNGKA